MNCQANGGYACGKIEENTHTAVDMIFGAKMQVEEQGAWIPKDSAVTVIGIIPMRTHNGEAQGACEVEIPSWSCGEKVVKIIACFHTHRHHSFLIYIQSFRIGFIPP